MGKYTAVMHRNEKKYCLDKNQYDAFIKAISVQTQRDSYGVYTISNIYLDNDAFESISKSMDKPLFKEKLRLRSYETPNASSFVFLESKKKFSGVVYKRRVQLSLINANRYLFADKLPNIIDQTFKEIDWVRQSMALSPRMFIAYDRIAFCANDDRNVRLTVDSNIRWRTCDLGLEKGNAGHSIANGTYILEVKVTNAIPLWLSEILSELEIYPKSFSKYSQCYLDLLKRKGRLSL